MLITKKYPFIVSIKDVLRKELGIETDISVLIRDPWLVELTLKRFTESLREKIAPESSGETFFEEISSFYLSMTVAKNLGIRILEKIIDAEVNRVRSFLKKESFDTLVELCKGLGITILNKKESFPWYIDIATGKKTNRVLNIAIPVSEYLRGIATSDTNELALQNSFLKKGLIYLDRKRLELMLVEIIRKKLKEIVNELPELNSNEEIVAKAKHIASKYLGPLDISLSSKDLLNNLPPCLSKLIDEAKKNGLESLELEKGLLLANFLASMKETSLVKEIFSNDPKLRPFMELLFTLKRTGAFIPTCSRLKELNLCLEKCLEKTPLHAYIKKIKSKNL